MMRFGLLAKLLVLLALLVPQAAQAAWLRADTHNFVIYSSGSRADLERFARDAEQFDAMLRLRFHVPAQERPVRLTIFMLGSSDDVGRLHGERGFLRGFYQPSRYGSYAVVGRDRAESAADLSGREVLFHEYAHHFMFRNSAFAYPAWYVEGFAEYVATATFEGSRGWTIGKPAHHRAHGLFSGASLSAERLLFDPPGSDDRERREVFYGRSWLLVHMASNVPERGAQLSRFLADIGRGVPHREAAAAFGDLAALDTALDRYMQGGLRFSRYDQPLAASAAITITPVDDLSGRLVMLGLQRRVARSPAETRDAIMRLAIANPARADVWYELALAEIAVGQRAGSEADRTAARRAAEAAVDRLLAAAPDHVLGNVLKGSLSTLRLRDEGDFTPGKWRAARGHIVRANTLDSEEPLALIAWYESFTRQGREPTPTARDGLAKAFAMIPEARDLRAQYAFDLARQGNYDGAIRVMEVLAFDPHSGAQGRAWLDRITAMRDRAAAGGTEALVEIEGD